MRVANSVPGLPSDYRCYGIADLGDHVEAKVARDKRPQACPRCRSPQSAATSLYAVRENRERTALSMDSPRVHVPRLM